MWYTKPMNDGVAAVQEAMRRRAGLGASSAGISGGAPAANANRPSNPLAQGGMIPQNPVGQGSMPPAPTAQNPLAGAASMMKDAAPNEAQTIIKYMGDRLKKLPTGSESLQMI